MQGSPCQLVGKQDQAKWGGSSREKDMQASEIPSIHGTKHIGLHPTIAKDSNGQSKIHS
jgi:hypothetical protein